MELKIIFNLFILFVLFSTATSQVFGGTPAVEGDIKYLVFLQITTTTADGRRRDFSGGGTIIRKYWILTAGHNLGAKTIDGTTYRTTRVRIPEPKTTKTPNLKKTLR